MEAVMLIVVLVVLLVFFGLLWSITNSRKQGQAKVEVAQTLGLIPVKPDETLLTQISALYQTNWNKPRHSLHNVMQRKLPDGELILFDLVDRDYESDSWIERQAVAIRSFSLHLPPFQVYPKVDITKYALGGLAKNIVEWGASQQGTLVHFSQFREFEVRYIVTSMDTKAVQHFFDECTARYFANTEFYSLRANGDLFVFTEIDPGFKVNDPSHMTRRINRALEIYRLFQNKIVK